MLLMKKVYLLLIFETHHTSEIGEKKMIDTIFLGRPWELKKLQRKVMDLRRFFKLSCRSYLSSQHQEDWESLEMGMVQSLEDHFDFWDSKLLEI